MKEKEKLVSNSQRKEGNGGNERDERVIFILCLKKKLEEFSHME